jgi:hypothetical protein
LSTIGCRCFAGTTFWDVDCLRCLTFGWAIDSPLIQISDVFSSGNDETTIRFAGFCKRFQLNRWEEKYWELTFDHMHPVGTTLAYPNHDTIRLCVKAVVSACAGVVSPNDVGYFSFHRSSIQVILSFLL